MQKETTYIIQVETDNGYIDTSFAYTNESIYVVKKQARAMFKNMGARHPIRIKKITKEILQID